MTLRFPLLPAVLTVALGVLAATAFTAATAAQAQDKPQAQRADMSPEQRKAVEDVVREYLLANPEVIVEAVRLFREREQQAQEERAKQALAAHKDALINGAESPVAGNPKGDVTVVEFFDYHCGYCKRVFPVLRQLVSEDKNLRWVFKEFPILGPESVIASRAALAAWKLDPTRYLDFHTALMKASGGLPEDRVVKIAQSVGYDGDKLRAAMKADAVTGEIDHNHQLAEILGIRGTPAFVVGGDLVPGAVDIDTLRRLIAKARKG